MSTAPRVDDVIEADLPELLPLMEAYLAFYETSGERAALEQLCRALLADREREGIQLLARSPDGVAVGFATVYWTWTTTRVGRLGVMNDLFVAPAARGSGAADALILAARDRAAARGCVALAWQTALENHRAQAVYDRVGGQRSQWLSYQLPAAGGRLAT